MPDMEEKVTAPERPVNARESGIPLPLEGKEIHGDPTLSPHSSSNSTATSDTISPEQPGGIEAGRQQQPVDHEPYPPPVTVPRSERRGILARFTILAEIENAVHYERKKKWIITSIVSLCGSVAPFSSAILLRKSCFLVPPHHFFGS